MREVEPQEESWNIKRIIIGVFILCLLLGSSLYFKDLLNKNKLSSQTNAINANVKGESTSTDEQIDTSSKEPSVSLPSAQQIKDSITNQLDSLRQQVLTLNPGEIASSSPQVQKILNDLKAMQRYPQSQAHQICENICKSL